ncbi:circularly permuted type 2 ATP-grasp protein [Methyloligella sp. 2.7D]|uniref:circularly permuted type 2 ATP-grasp protein n=1 Tax=unclassified Methyloligella TaxID=2625955 RepID=UPI00157BCAFB|nr:circularly permuted type 2 ATP-grasp protein [Methyloligella sp. GL2]QKP78879.1 circularly permuted type 2 ATP-grasp protein [Methyloligella sp. GL2]
MRCPDGTIRPAYADFAEFLEKVTVEELTTKTGAAEELFRRVGITFAVYTEGGSTERLIPFDIIPRIIDRSEWDLVERGCVQRVKAINTFLYDIYHEQEIIKAGIVPPELVLLNPAFQPEMMGVDLPNDVYAHIAGIDLVRTGARDFFVLEDNVRTPSGVSYLLENREVMMRLFPDAFANQNISPVGNYSERLIENLRSVSPGGDEEPVVVLMTPGRYNSAYFEHVFLAEQMGVELVEGSDLFVRDGYVWMRTTEGPVRVDVIYRRIDDPFIDPLAFRQDSLLGVPGLLSAVRLGTVNLANAIGTGVADDKAMYTYVPRMIEFYLGEHAILKNVQTYMLRDPSHRKYVFENLHDLVVKEVHGSGGYGMLIGPASTAAEREAYKKRVEANPSDFIAQPTLKLSTAPTFADGKIVPRHVDLRPFVLSGKETSVIPGGLTRVALREGSLVVNSSQGGGTKDTWVLEDAK